MPETIQRVVGILTEALEMRRQVRENPNSDIQGGETIAAMLEEMLPRIEVPADATVQEVSVLVSRELEPFIAQLASAFALAFVRLAEVHDESRNDVSTVDVLRSISLRFENQNER
ncbi:hypothetical protein [Streptomyces sp. Tu 3180]|uniref:hypothetical protein n=1 Tax=Streptomyces sp. Tu 3180 TaxID=2682611 RepID=UPI00135BC476|nr:hypothetical protein [Streptomyces sp. Tu 3180]KAF3463307.1 hypothetical protein GL259_02290 [Streptomyces sp. Tu 3180]